jgi:DNA-binding transcriptional regulator GbsR (MarR family)
VWVRGDRKDYYEANDWLGKVLTGAIRDLVSKKLASYARLITEIESEVAASRLEDGDGEFVKERLKRLRAFQKRAERLWSHPAVRQLLR